ncbi:alanine dehydrogenase [Vibrio zhugei]|uniref:Alanine dehydrogenase n=1 Tax=Vibrio zhugei TaxID=2479546 RepID=A0ABV7CAH1_9VIBR|nr:alanine dehydrogenase [Vibrio zhugei]
MIIGVPKELKNHEYRVGLTPASAKELIAHGHQVMIETNAGFGIGISDSDYIAAGASILPTATEVFSQADMIIKVKEPLDNELIMLRKGQILFTYLHLAPDFPQTEALIKSKAICIAYETVTDYMGRLPLLAPMSEVAGRMSVQAGANILEKSKGGQGILLGGVPGVAPANVLILGAGVVGSSAARIALGMRVNVTLIDRNIEVLRGLDREFQGKATLLFATQDAIETQLKRADLVIGAVLIPGAQAPKLVSKQQLALMKPRAVLVDVAIDQGGCFATSRPTTHDEPTFIEQNIIHYCVANMPGAIARTATLALNNATLPYIINIANLGYQQAMRDDPGLKQGLNICQGHITCQHVAEGFGLPYVPADELINSDS